VGRHRPADDPAAEEVLHGDQIQPALAGADLLDVRTPHAVRGVGPKIAADEVAERLDALHGHRAALATPTVGALQAHLRHQARHALLTDPDPLPTQHRVHARAAVAATARGMNLTDPLGQPRIRQRTIRRRPPGPRPVPGLRDAEQLALQGDDHSLGLLGFRDVPVDAHRVPVSRAKKAVACLRMSRSCSRRRTRFLSSRSSSRSTLVSPSSRTPRSRSPWRRQFRSVCGDTPKLSATSGIERPARTNSSASRRNCSG
jgi:hypothetical protein